MTWKDWSQGNIQCWGCRFITKLDLPWTSPLKMRRRKHNKVPFIPNISLKRGKLHLSIVIKNIPVWCYISHYKYLRFCSQFFWIYFFTNGHLLEWNEATVTPRQSFIQNRFALFYGKMCPGFTLWMPSSLEAKGRKKAVSIFGTICSCINYRIT